MSETSKNDNRREGEVHGAFRTESIEEGIALSTGEAAYIDCPYVFRNRWRLVKERMYVEEN